MHTSHAYTPIHTPYMHTTQSWRNAEIDTFLNPCGFGESSVQHSSSRTGSPAATLQWRSSSLCGRPLASRPSIPSGICKFLKKFQDTLNTTQNKISNKYYCKNQTTEFLPVLWSFLFKITVTERLQTLSAKCNSFGNFNRLLYLHPLSAAVPEARRLRKKFI